MALQDLPSSLAWLRLGSGPLLATQPRDLAIMLSAGEATGDNFYRAAVAIFFGNFFDAFDGRVARMTKTQSEFGVELDSLADVITFGVAPAILVSALPVQVVVAA